MPFTFAHPAAVLPFRAYCPRFLNLPALIVGSLAPDLGYYLHNWVWSIAGHSFLGSLTFDLPAGLVLLALFYLNLRPVSRLLPYPHREACSAICPALVLPGFRSLLLACLSILAGAWTHIIWDGFTHENGWCVRKFASVTPTLFVLGDYHVTVWHILQHASTVIGLLVLAFAYKRYAFGKRFLKHQSLLPSKMRLAILFLLMALPAVPAVSRNIYLLSGGLTIPRLDVFVFNGIVAYVCNFLPLLCATGIFVSLLEYFRRPGSVADLPELEAAAALLPLSLESHLPAAAPTISQAEALSLSLESLPVKLK